MRHDRARFYLNRAPDLLARMVDAGQVLVPTLSFLHHVANPERWVTVLEEQGEVNVREALKTLQAAKDANVTIAVGSNSPDPEGVAREVGRLVEHGMTATQALTAATLHGARALGIHGSVGSIAPGMIADLAVIDGDVLQEPSLLGRADKVWLVLRNGDPVAGTALEATL